MLRALLELSRVSNLPTVWTNVLAAWIIASGRDWAWTPALCWLLLGASLMYSAGMVLNDAFDATWDREHRPERPIPSGRISLRAVWVIGLSGLLGGAAIMIFLGGANWLMTLLLLAAIAAYDLYHKPWAGSVFVMGACRTLLYLAAGNSLADDGRPPVFEGATLGVYIVGLTLAARSETPGQWTGLAAISGVVLLFGSIVAAGLLGLINTPSQLSEVSDLPWGIACVGMLCWTGFALLQISKRGRHIGVGVGMMLAAIPLMDGLFISMLSPGWTLAFIGLPPLLRLWQRWIAAT